MKSSPSSTFNLEQAIARENSLHRNGVQIEELNTDTREPLSIAIHGKGGVGKTRFGMTMPAPIGVVPLGKKCRATVEQARKEFGKRVLMPKQDLVRLDNPLFVASLKAACNQASLKIDLEREQPKCCAIHYFRWHVDRVKSVIYRFAAMPDEQCKSILIDDGSILYEDIQFANHGRRDDSLFESKKVVQRDRASDFAEMREIWNACARKHVVMIHRSKPIWKDNTDTGRVGLRGWADTPYEASVTLRLESNADDIANLLKSKKDTERRKAGEMQVQFSAVVEMCQANAAAIGERVDESDFVTFPYIATLVYPNTELEDWE